MPTIPTRRSLQDIVRAVKARGASLRATEHPIDTARIKAMKADGMGASAIAKALGIGRASVYRALDD